MRKSDKRRVIEEMNKRILNETHVSSNQDKINYIKKALSNLSSEDLDKIYLSVEELDPEYVSK